MNGVALERATRTDRPTHLLDTVEETTMSNAVWAYIDPGTGSIVLQVVIGSLLGASFFLREKIKRLFSWKTIATDDDSDNLTRGKSRRG